MIDVDLQISAVTRTVGNRTLEAGEARVVTVSQTYPTDVDDLWNACTTPDRITRWFLPITGDLKVGGTYQLEGNAGGTVEKCDPPNTFAATWEYGGEVSWIEVTISAEGADKARFTLEHVAHVDDERWTQYGPGAVGIGWDGGLLGLAMYLATGEQNDPEESTKWQLSDEGKQFTALSSAQWRDAAIAGGDDPAAAAAAADRTTAAYTGAE